MNKVVRWVICMALTAVVLIVLHSVAPAMVPNLPAMLILSSLVFGIVQMIKN